MATDPVLLARSLHAAIGAGQHGDDLRHFFAANARLVEQPNRFNPTGGSHSVAEFLAKSSAGVKLLANQRFELIAANTDGDTAILRLRWVGVLAQDLPPFQQGQELVAQIAQFVDTAAGRITRLETYDCYEPID